MRIQLPTGAMSVHERDGLVAPPANIAELGVAVISERGKL